MNKLWIPKPKDCITLTNDWEFSLFFERRNHKLFALADPAEFARISNMKYSFDVNKSENFIKFILPKKTILQCDRVFIRNNSDEFNSLTWRIVKHPYNPKFAKQRFWAKLNDVNMIEFEHYENIEQIQKNNRKIQNQEELDFIKQKFCEILKRRHSYSEDVTRRFEKIRDDVVDYFNSESRTALRYDLYSPGNWYCLSSVKKDDLKFRTFKIHVLPSTSPGFIVSSKDDEIISVKLS